MTTLKHPPQPHLEGVQVLDLTRLLPGPFCSLLLADMGADVLKVEDTRGGDYARYHPPVADDGVGAFFASLNRNKRAIALDLKQPRGVQLLEALIKDADVVLESFRPGVMERLGLGWERLQELNPRIICCAISGYGQDGPYREKAGHDINYLALSGLLEQTGRPGEAPVVPGFQLADIAGGALYAALGITAALYGREQTGKGSYIDISMTEGALSLHLPEHGRMRQGAHADRGDDILTGGVPCYGVYETGDGHYVAVGSLEPKFWMGLLTVLDEPSLMADGLDRGEAGARVRAKIAAKFKERTRDKWAEVFAGTDICCEPILSPEEALESELHKARQMFFMLQGKSYTRTPLSAVTEQGTPAPAHGQHNDEVFGEHLSPEELAELRASGVIL